MLTIEKIYIREIVKISFDVDLATISDHFKCFCFEYYFLRPEKVYLVIFCIKSTSILGNGTGFLLLSPWEIGQRK